MYKFKCMCKVKGWGVRNINRFRARGSARLGDIVKRGKVVTLLRQGFGAPSRYDFSIRFKHSLFFAIRILMKQVIVTGANGFVGSNLCKELLDAGYKVRALHRKSSNIETLKDLDVELVEGDITNIKDLQKAFEGCEVVYHIAALFRQAKHPDSVYWDINHKGVKNVFEVAIEKGVKKVIHCSTVGVHSHIPNPPANEDEEYRPGDIYQETKCAGEKLALEYFRSGKIQGSVIRPAMIWGPGDERTLKLYKGIGTNKFPLIGTGKTHLHWILVTDLARSFRLASEKEVPNGEVFIISGRESISMRRLYDEIADCFGVKAPRFAIPALPIQIIGTIVEAICIPFGIEPPIYRRRVDFFTKTRWFDSSKAKSLLGFEPKYNFTDEVSLIADWYKEKGWV